ncbi:unnamed protein product [Adineta steineri]|nr:unnamed protein product [Adineta steineri]CAF0748063.1 unnamed protein product [Adineta steineri]
MLRAINSFELYLFSISELLVIAREKRTNTLVARLDSINDTDHVSESSAWFGEANWEYDSVSPTILFIVCSVKVGSNDQLWSSKLSIILDRHCMRIRKGDLTHLASNEEELKKQQYAYYKDLVEQLPPPKRTGPEIPITKIQSQEVVTYECEGDSVVRMHCGNKNTIITKQEHGFRDDETFLQYFTITNIVISRDPSIVPNISQQKHSVSTNNRLSITRFVVMYQAHDTLWHECDQVKIAPSTRYGEPDWYRDITLNIEPDKTISLTIQGMIVVNGEIGMDSDGRSQLHNSLPQPFKTKIIIHDNTGKQCSLIVEQWNKPIQVITRESFVERDHNSIKELLAFIYVDDCNVDKRIFAAAYLDYRHRLVIHVNNSPRTLELQHVRTLEFYARQNGFLESSLSADHYRSSDIQCNAIGLFDSKTYMLYAIRFELATKTSTYEETIPLPLDKIQ